MLGNSISRYWKVYNSLSPQLSPDPCLDDPYYFLYFSDKPKAPSYFALEAQDGGKTGVVLRFDSLSKILSSGLRIGFATGPKTLLDVIDLHVR